MTAALLLAASPIVAYPYPASAQEQPGPPGRSATPTTGRPEVVDDELLVKFRPGTPAVDRAAGHRQAAGQVVREIRGLDVQVVKVPAGQALGRLQAYARNPNVEYAEPNGIAYVDGMPSDTLYTQQWALHNIGQNGGRTDADIDAPQAWDVLRPAGSAVVAIVDTGVRGDHPDLVSKVIPSRNWTTSSPDTVDRYGHGTHVAGSVAALTGNGTGVAGVCPECDLISAKVCGDDGGCNYDWIANGVLWAVGCDVRDQVTDECRIAPRARVINLSLGGTYNSITLGNAVARAWQRGAVLTCAAGNNGNSVRFYPAAYTNCIAVAATDNRDRRASFSNFGNTWVDVAAPGVGILSTVVSGGYESWNGTSMATPHVAGLAGLLWSKGLSTPTSVRSAIESNADRISGTGNAWAKGRINACRALGGTGC